jgi:hypothetical protein
MDPQPETTGPARQNVLEEARRLLGDGQPRTAKEIAAELGKRGLGGVDKSLVNSVLSREGHGEFAYDRTSYTYSLGGEPASDTGSPPARSRAPQAAPAESSVPRQAVLDLTRAVLRDGQPRTSREIAAELVKRGLAGVDKSLVNSVLSREGRGQFSYDRTAYTYSLSGEPEPG